MNQKTTAARFRLPYTTRQVYTMLLAACKAEVTRRQRQFIDSDEYNARLQNIARWLTSSDSTFGLFLCGGAGTGKTTIIKALRNLLEYLNSDRTPFARYYNPSKDFKIITAKELVRLAKAYNSPSRDNIDECEEYLSLRNVEILAIDDLGAEPSQSMHYGDFVTAAMDILAYRYEEQFCTIVSSNLTPQEVSQHYDERLADRFREMMHTVQFGNLKSFRTTTSPSKSERNISPLGATQIQPGATPGSR